MEHISDLPVYLPASKQQLQEEAMIASAVDNLPSVAEAKGMIAAVVTAAARDIVLGKVTWKDAKEASTVARNFVAIAKDLEWGHEAKEMAKAESDEERKAAFELFRQQAHQNMKKTGGGD